MPGIVNRSQGNISVNQIQFAATGASTNANSLDWYEEGIIVAGLMDTSSDSTGEGQTYGSRGGAFTRIGNQVLFNLIIVVNGTGTLSTGDQALISGLPYNASTSVTDQFTPVFIASATGLTLGAADRVVTGVIVEDHINLELWDSSAGTTPLLIQECSSSFEMQISGHYRV